MTLSLSLVDSNNMGLPLWCLLIVAVGLPPWVWVLLAMGLGFAHGGRDHGLLHLVLIVLMVDWCYSLSTFLFCFVFVFGVDGRLWVAGSGGVRCV